MSIFDRRVAFKPFEYPTAMQFVDAINHSYWVHSEWNFVSDVQDFKVRLTDQEREVVRRALLAISQIEVSVKSFWGKVEETFPKPEIGAVGTSFSESEIRHFRAYSHLLEVLSLNDDFEAVLEVPEIQGRVDYLTKYLKGASDGRREKYTLTLTLFSLFIENVSLFSQFLVVKSFNKQRNILKDVDNVIQATAQEEALHALFGAWLVNRVKEEYPDWFDDTFYAKIERACKKAYEAESAIIDWIFESGELDFMSKHTVKEFIKERFNRSLEMIGAEKCFEVDEDAIKQTRWFDEEMQGYTHADFFLKKSTNYSKKTQSYTEDDLF